MTSAAAHLAISKNWWLPVNYINLETSGKNFIQFGGKFLTQLYIYEWLVGDMFHFPSSYSPCVISESRIEENEFC